MCLHQTALAHQTCHLHAPQVGLITHGGWCLLVRPLVHTCQYCQNHLAWKWRAKIHRPERWVFCSVLQKIVISDHDCIGDGDHWDYAGEYNSDTIRISFVCHVVPVSSAIMSQWWTSHWLNEVAPHLSSKHVWLLSFQKKLHMRYKFGIIQDGIAIVCPWM